MRFGLGIDAGGTSTRWTVVDAGGASVANGTVDPVSGHLFTAAQRKRAFDGLEHLSDAVLQHCRPTAITAGITGLNRGTPAEALISSMLATCFGLPTGQVFVADDMWIAYRARFQPGEGVFIYSGTGSVGYHLTTGNVAMRVGGRGFLIDDAGSGFWLAKEALRVVLRMEDELDGSGWATPLGVALGRGAGGTSWDEVRRFVYGGERGQIAGLSRFVAEAAAAGDSTATGLLTDAGRELGQLALRLRARVGDLPTALSGGTANLHPAVFAAFRATLPAESDVSLAKIDAAFAAARLAAEGI